MGGSTHTAASKGRRILAGEGHLFVVPGLHCVNRGAQTKTPRPNGNSGLEDAEPWCMQPAGLLRARCECGCLVLPGDVQRAASKNAGVFRPRFLRMPRLRDASAAVNTSSEMRVPDQPGHTRPDASPRNGEQTPRGKANWRLSLFITVGFSVCPDYSIERTDGESQLTSDAKRQSRHIQMELYYKE